MIEEYKIQKGTLTAIADKFRDILRSFKEDIGANGLFNSDAVTVYYIEYVDYSEQYDTLSPVKTTSDKFVAYDFIEDNNGKVTPVIYRIDSESERYADIIDYGEPYFYIDQAEIDGVLYDKWRKIEPDDEDFGWDGSSKKYIYTNVLLNNDKYSPTNFPAKISEVYNAGYNSGLGTLIEVDELPNSGIKENTVYSYNGALYIYVDGEWIDYIVPSGVLNITENGTHDVTDYASVEVDVPIPDGYIVPTGSVSITSNGTVNVTNYASATVNVPIPSGYIKPSGTATITTNNSTTDITSYASVKVAISEYKGTVVIE